MTLDLRGLKCPWPAIRLGKALRELPADAAQLAVIADDPRAGAEMAEVASEAGWALRPDPTDPDHFHVNRATS